MDREEILSKANIEEKLWDYCFVDEIKGIWQPQMNKMGEIIKIGEELYAESLFPPSPILPTPEEMVIAEMSMSMAQMQTENSQAIAELTTALAMMQVPLV